MLAGAFVQRFATRMGRRVDALSDEQLKLLRDYDWPGNVRELRSAIEHAVAFSRTDRVDKKDLPADVREPGTAVLALGTPLADQNLTVHEAEKQLIIRALKESEGNRTLAAKKIGISRRTLHRKLHTYHLEAH